MKHATPGGLQTVANTDVIMAAILRLQKGSESRVVGFKRERNRGDSFGGEDDEEVHYILPYVYVLIFYS